MLDIPITVIVVFAVLNALEFALRFVFLTPRNPLWLGKAAVRLYIASIYILLYMSSATHEFRQVALRYGMALMFFIDFAYAVIDHYLCYKGVHKGSWLCALMSKRARSKNGK